MNKICPLPLVWNEIYNRLLNKWNQDGANGEKPPVPLIMNGWVFSNDTQKEKVWNQTIAWAEMYGYSNIISGIEDEGFYWADSLTDYEVGPTV